MSATQEWIKQKFQEEGLGYVVYNNERLTDEVQELQARIKTLEMDMAHIIKNRNIAFSPEEQKIYDLKE